MGFANCAVATPCLASLDKTERFPSLLPEEEVLKKSHYLPWLPACPAGAATQHEQICPVAAMAPRMMPLGDPLCTVLSLLKMCLELSVIANFIL